MFHTDPGTPTGMIRRLGGQAVLRRDTGGRPMAVVVKLTTPDARVNARQCGTVEGAVNQSVRDFTVRERALAQRLIIQLPGQLRRAANGSIKASDRRPPRRCLLQGAVLAYRSLKAMAAITVGGSAPRNSPTGNRAVEEAAEQRLTGGVRRIGDHRQAAAGHRAFHHRDLQRLVQVRHQRREIRDQRVVVERREQRRAEEQRRSRRGGRAPARSTSPAGRRGSPGRRGRTPPAAAP